MLGFLGTFRCKLDSKHRLVLPARLRDKFPKSYSEKSEDKNKIILRMGFEEKLKQNHLTLYPTETFQEIIEQFNGLNRFRRLDRDIRRTFMAGIEEVEMDDNFRFLIPNKMVQDLKLKKDIVLIGAVDEIEIWDSEVWEKAYTPNKIDELTEEWQESVSKDNSFIGN